MTLDFEPRAVCMRCRRPERVCWCKDIATLDTKTRVVLLQHPRERDMPIGTARMANLCLSNSELHVGVRFEGSSSLNAAIGDPERPAMLLYPSEDAVDVQTSPPKGPITLVVVDGTWWQAKKLIRENPKIAALPKIAFTPEKPSEYRIRREPLPSYVSTIEALVHVLSRLEDEPERFQGMLAPFRKMIDVQIEHARTIQGGRTRHGKRNKGPRPPKIDARTRLWEQRRELVCVMGEANAWPFDRERTDELVYWTAYRPWTNELFSVVVAPEDPIAPFTSEHIGIDEDTLRRGVTKPELFARWSNFVKPTDTICSWGPYATRLFLRAGGDLPARRVDIRQLARDRAHREGRRNVGSMDDVLATLAEDEASASASTSGIASRIADNLRMRTQGLYGRGGERLMKLVSVVEKFARIEPNPSPSHE